MGVKEVLRPDTGLLKGGKHRGFQKRSEESWYLHTPSWNQDNSFLRCATFPINPGCGPEDRGGCPCVRLLLPAGVSLPVTTALSPGRCGNSQTGGSHETPHRFFGERCNATGVGNRGPRTGPAGARRDAAAVHFGRTELLVGDGVGGGPGVVPFEEFSGVRSHRVSAGKHARRTSGR